MTSRVTQEPANDRWAHLFEDTSPFDDEGSGKTSRRLLGDLLVGCGLITFSDLDEALEIQRRHGGRIGEILVAEGRLTLDQLLDAVSEQHGIAREQPVSLRARLGERRPDAA